LVGSCSVRSSLSSWSLELAVQLSWYVSRSPVLKALTNQTTLRRLPCFPSPAEPESARAAQPAPLSAAELAKLPVVCYIPHPDPHSPTEKASMAEKQSTPSAHSWDATRLPYPAHPLRSDRAMCAICQENFTEPESVRRVLYQAEPLRLLGCGHIYHVS